MALILALNVPGKPVKMIWSREDDIRNDKLRPLTAQRIEVGLDADNNIVGWRQRIVNEFVSSRASCRPTVCQDQADIVSGGGGEMSYGGSEPPRRVGALRSRHRCRRLARHRGGLHQIRHRDDDGRIAALKKMDPLDYRLAMLKDEPRAANVLKRVAEMSNYKAKRNGRAVGIAYSDALNSHTAVAAEVSVDTKSGQIKVHHLWAAVDPGQVVQPKNIAAQITSAMTFGLGAALIEQMAIKDGVMQATNFDGYPVLRMSDVPPMEVAVISTNDPPTGIGEAGVPAVAPAIANAVAQLTGKRCGTFP